ncbi:FAD-dependent oxidoreductase [Brevibacillus formosus]|nr:FAD-dependent oxidoreductase [Brevibacillus formosus]
MRKNQKIVVVGAGIVGATMAYYLSKQSQNVTLLETNSSAACE